MPRCRPVPGGIRDGEGKVIAPDPATLPPDELRLSRRCGGIPICCSARPAGGRWSSGLPQHVQVVGQPSYNGFEGGQGQLYSSAILMRGSEAGVTSRPADGAPIIPLDLIRGKRFAYNSLDSMSGIIAPTRDLEAMGESLDIFSERIETGSHRASIVAVAEGRADVCAIDCRSWHMAEAPRAEGQAKCRSSAGPACARACR